MIRLFILLIIVVPAVALADAASDPLYDELEGPALAEALLRDGKQGDCRKVLDSLSSGDNRKPLAGKVRGELALLEGKPAEAASHFQGAIDKGADAELAQKLYLGLARAEQRRGKHKECAAAAVAAGSLVFKDETDLLLRSGCEKSSGKFTAAWQTLAEGRKAGLGTGVLVEHLRLMLDLQLREEAFQTVQKEMLKVNSSADAMAMAEVLAEGGAKQESLLALEIARLRFPTDQDLLLAIAPLYFSQGMKRATAESFALASVRDRSYAEHAAETLRQTGSRQRSRYMNQFIPGEKERGRQRLALAVESSRWDLVASMDSLVKRTALEGDDEVSYALAYSLLRGGERERAQSYLESVKTSSLLTKVSALLKNIEGCATKGWRCL